MMITVVFVVITLLLILAALGVNIAPEANRPLLHNGAFVLIVIDLCILGWKVFGGRGG